MSCPPPSKRAKFERKPDLYAEDFNHPKADVILRCREGRKKEEGGATLFAIRRLMLIAASPFFEDLFDLPQGKEVERVRWEGAHDLGFLPVVDLEEDYLDIGAVFGLVHRFDHTQFNDLQMEHLIKDHLRLLDIADKYNVVGAVLLISASLGDLLGTEDTLAIIGLAFIHRLPNLARKAIEQWGKDSTALETAYKIFVGDIRSTASIESL